MTARPPARDLTVSHEVGLVGFRAALSGLLAVAESLDDTDLLAASRCRGWTVGDTLVHVHLGLQDMLLGLVHPTDRSPDTDAAGYWAVPVPRSDPGADPVAGIRFIRALGAAYRRPTGAVGHLRPTADGVIRAAGALAPGAVEFQGRVVGTGDFPATWAVELAVHHLDLGRELAIAPPAAAGLRLARATVEALVGQDLPAGWTDEDAALTGAGRRPLTPAQAAELGAGAAAFPVLG